MESNQSGCSLNRTSLCRGPVSAGVGRRRQWSLGRGTGNRRRRDLSSCSNRWRRGCRRRSRRWRWRGSRLSWRRRHRTARKTSILKRCQLSRKSRGSSLQACKAASDERWAGGFDGGTDTSEIGGGSEGAGKCRNGPGTFGVAEGELTRLEGCC